MRRFSSRCFVFLLAIMVLTACNSSSLSSTEQVQYERYRGSFFDTFDTVVMVVGYTETKEEFEIYLAHIEKRFQELHKLFDIYNDYEGINNVKTINDNAGIQPIQVDREIIELILMSKEWHEQYDGKTNIAMGAVLKIWHDYRENGIDDPLNAVLPPMADLQEAAKHIDIDQVIVDIEHSTVYLADEKMSLNVGAIAKGFATELVAQEIYDMGLTSAIINAGGNVRVLDKPLDYSRKTWAVGVQDPNKIAILAEENIVETIYINNLSVVSSGDNQRFFVVDGKAYHHLIDPETLMPGDYYRAMTVVTEDSGFADLVSTEAFLLPFEDSIRLVESIDGVEALWIMPNGTIRTTDALKPMLKSYGATADY